MIAANARNILFLISLCCFFPIQGNSQFSGTYPPFTKWYQDPLGLKPLELSTAAGFPWSAAVVAACLVFTKKDSFIQNRFSFYEEAGFGLGYKPPYTNSVQNETGLFYDVRKWMVIGLGGNIFRFKDDINNTWTFGFRPFVRWYPYSKNKIKLFFEYGAGCSYSLSRFPLTGTELEADTGRTGTRFNFTSKYSAGIVFLISNTISLQQAALRHFHLSNGNIRGINRNPSYDCNGLFLGIIYRLPENE